MMAVQLILDGFGIDTEAAVIVKTQPNDIIAVRRQIDQHLQQQSEKLLRIRVNSHALFKRFSDYEGQNGVLPTQHLIPRVLLAQSLNTGLPIWLTDELIITLDLLQKGDFLTPQRSFETSLLIACDADLLSSDIHEFITALTRQNTQFIQLLAVAAVKETFCRHIVSGLSLTEEIARLLLEELVKADDIRCFLHTLAYQQHLDCLRRFVSTHQLNQALPPKIYPVSLLQALPLLALPEKEANDLPDKFIKALHAAERSIPAQGIKPEAINDLLVDWPLLLSELAVLASENAILITQALLDRLRTFSSQESRDLLTALQQRLDSYPLLDATAIVDDALNWSSAYFDYCRKAFLAKQPLDDSVNLSFSEWLLAQQARISRSVHDWRSVSDQACSYLEQAYTDVIIIVDALSALNQDILLDELNSLDHLTLRQQMLFSPLPTLTEVCKMAVLTGQPVSDQQYGNQETILRHAYQNYLAEEKSLKVIQSWAESSERTERIEEQTQLVVLFENRLDERLHECPSFSKHREDIRPIIRQIKRSIMGWCKDAARLNKEVVFFITADHGMTVTQELYAGQALGEVKERVYKLKSSMQMPDEFTLIGDYAVPKKRCRLTPHAWLTHGGLTPEEVLIPFITLSSKPPRPSATPLDLKLTDVPCLVIANKYWQIEVLLTANTTINNIQIYFAKPFDGKESIDSIRANRQQTIKINFNSMQEQEGLTEVELLLTYDCADRHEKNTKRLSVKFPVALLEKDAGTQSFEDMF